MKPPALHLQRAFEGEHAAALQSYALVAVWRGLTAGSAAPATKFQDVGLQTTDDVFLRALAWYWAMVIDG